MQNPVGTAVVMVVALVATAEAALVALAAQYIGFPDGFETGLDRLRQITYPVTATVFGAVAVAAVAVAVQLARGKLRGRRPMAWMLGVWIAVNALGFAVDRLCAYLKPPQAEMGALFHGAGARPSPSAFCHQPTSCQRPFLNPMAR